MMADCVGQGVLAFFHSLIQRKWPLPNINRVASNGFLRVSPYVKSWPLWGLSCSCVAFCTSACLCVCAVRHWAYHTQRSSVLTRRVVRKSFFRTTSWQSTTLTTSAKQSQLPKGEEFFPSAAGTLQVTDAQCGGWMRRTRRLVLMWQ